MKFGTPIGRRLKRGPLLVNDVTAQRKIHYVSNDPLRNRRQECTLPTRACTRICVGVQLYCNKTNPCDPNVVATITQINLHVTQLNTNSSSGNKERAWYGPFGQWCRHCYGCFIVIWCNCFSCTVVSSVLLLIMSGTMLIQT